MPKQAPKHLKSDTAAWFRQVSREYVLTESESRLLLLAAEGYNHHEETPSRG